MKMCFGYPTGRERPGRTTFQIVPQSRRAEKKKPGQFFNNCKRLQTSGQRLHSSRTMGEPLFVINGFYMSMREKFTLPEAKLHYFVVDWSADALSWEDFRGKVLGATDPATAEDGAIRKMILDKWEELGLKSLPNVGDNGVHASASPS